MDNDSGSDPLPVSTCDQLASAIVWNAAFWLSDWVSDILKNVLHHFWTFLL